MAEHQRACGKIKPRLGERDCTIARPKGGPRDVCLKPRGHYGNCGNWELLTDAEHGDVLSGRKLLELPVFDRGHAGLAIPARFAELAFE